MLLTLFLALVFILAVCALLYAAVVLIQDRRFFTTAPKDIQAAVKDHPERFPGAHALGWSLAILCLLLMMGAFVYGGYDGVRNGFTFWRHFLRFAVMLYLWKAFDIVCLDWLLLTRSHFFQHFYPETEGCAGYRQFIRRQSESKVRLNDAVQEFIEVSRDLKSCNAEDAYLSELEEKIDDVEKKAIGAELGQAVFIVSAQLLLKIGMLFHDRLVKPQSDLCRRGAGVGRYRREPGGPQGRSSLPSARSRAACSRS